MAAFRIGLSRVIAISLTFCVLSFALSQAPAENMSVVRWVSTPASSVFRKNNAAWCSGGIHVEISTAQPAFFKSENDQYPSERQSKKKLLTDLKVALASDCPRAKIVRVSGFVKGKYVFEGCMEKEEGWELKEVAYSENDSKLLDPYYFEHSPECRLPEDASIFLAEYLAMMDHLTRFTGPECMPHAQAMWGIGKTEAEKFCSQ